MDLLWQSLLVYALGIAISMLVAVVIWGVDYLVACGSAQGARPQPARPQLARPQPGFAAGPGAVGRAPVGALPAHHLAAIAAAVAASTATPHRILHIEESARGRFWTAEGRMIHQTSHAPRRRGS